MVALRFLLFVALPRLGRQGEDAESSSACNEGEEEVDGRAFEGSEDGEGVGGATGVVVVLVAESDELVAPQHARVPHSGLRVVEVLAEWRPLLDDGARETLAVEGNLPESGTLVVVGHVGPEVLEEVVERNVAVLRTPQNACQELLVGEVGGRGVVESGVEPRDDGVRPHVVRRDWVQITALVDVELEALVEQVKDVIEVATLEEQRAEQFGGEPRVHKQAEDAQHEGRGPQRFLLRPCVEIEVLAGEESDEEEDNVGGGQPEGREQAGQHTDAEAEQREPG